MAQQVGAPAAKPPDESSVLGTGVIKGEKQKPRLLL